VSSSALWVVDPSVVTAEEEGASAIVQSWGGPARIFRPALSPGDSPEPGTSADVVAVVVMGSRASVADDLPWLGGLVSFLRPVVSGELRLPLLGICFGHQLVAHLAGGRVAYRTADRSKLAAVETTQFTGGRLLPGPTRLRVAVSHAEHVEEVPHGWRVVARRPSCPIDSLEHETLPIFTVQFHPEARVDFARRAGIDPALIDAELLADSARLLGGFFAHVRRNA
jgi:GMP synthase-like glutamine amidotransferase